MKTFKNTKADTSQDCTVLVHAQAEERNELLSDHWVECDESEVIHKTLYVQAGVRFFGVL